MEGIMLPRFTVVEPQKIAREGDVQAQTTKEEREEIVAPMKKLLIIFLALGSGYKPTCKLCGKQCDSLYAYCDHIDIDHGYNPRRKYEYERAIWNLQNNRRSKGVRLR